MKKIEVYKDDLVKDETIIGWLISIYVINNVIDKTACNYLDILKRYKNENSQNTKS